MNVPKDPNGEEGAVDCSSRLSSTSLYYRKGDHSASSEAKRTVLR